MLQMLSCSSSDNSNSYTTATSLNNKQESCNGQCLARRCPATDVGKAWAEAKQSIFIDYIVTISEHYEKESTLRMIGQSTTWANVKGNIMAQPIYPVCRLCLGSGYKRQEKKGRSLRSLCCLRAAMISALDQLSSVPLCVRWRYLHCLRQINCLSAIVAAAVAAAASVAHLTLVALVLELSSNNLAFFLLICKTSIC